VPRHDRRSVAFGRRVQAFCSRSLSIRDARARAEREAVQLAFAQVGSNLSKAAKLLGISRPTLYDLMQQHRIGLDL
jgi:two-component system, NtrC family, response regulator